MSQVIFINTLSKKEKLDLVAKLSITELIPVKYGQKKPEVTKSPVLCYMKDPADPANCLRVPFHFALDRDATTNDELHEVRRSYAKREGVKLNEFQLVEAKKMLEHLKTLRTTTLCLSTGDGKTAVSCIVSTVIKLRTVVLVQNKVLLEQWEKEFTKFTTALVEVVGENGIQESDADVFVCHIKRVPKIAQEIRDTIGFVIVDESHLHCNQTGANALLHFTPKFMLACDATPTRSRDGMYRVMELFYGKHMVKNKRKKEDMIVYRIKTEYRAEVVKGSRGTNWSTYIQSLLYNEERNYKIVDGVMKDVAEGARVMVITSEKKHVQVLYEMFLEAHPSIDWLSGNKKSYRCCDVLIANIQKGGVGFDDANKCENFDGKRIDTIWIVTEIANPESAEQAIGRSRDKAPRIKQLVDSEVLADRHWHVCRKVYIERGAKIEYVKLDW